MAPSTKTLYRIMLSNCKELFLRENREFLQAALDACSDTILTLKRGQSIMKKFPNNPRFELKRTFREGSSEDINAFFSLLPTIFRYSRAAKLIDQQFKSKSINKNNSLRKFNSQDDPNMLSGALLISKLYYNGSELKNRNIDEIVKNGINDISKLLKRELEKILLDRKIIEMKATEKLKTEMKNDNNMTLQDRRRSKILPIINALNITIQKVESRRLKDELLDHEYFIDQIIQPYNTIYHSTRAMPIIYSILYCSILNTLQQQQHISIEAIGIPFPRNFLSRIVVKGSQRNSTVEAPLYDKFGLPILKHTHTETPTTTSSSSNTGTGNNKRFIKNPQNIPTEVNFFHLAGQWIGFYTEGMQEIKIMIDHSKHLLIAYKIDGDKYVPTGEIAWQIDIKDICKNSNMLKIGVGYRVAVQIAKEGYKQPCFVLYTLTLHALPSNIFQPMTTTTAVLSNTPYFEIQLEPIIQSDEQQYAPSTDLTQPESEMNSTSANMRNSATGQRRDTRSTTTIVRTHTGASTHPSLSTNNSTTRSSNSANSTSIVSRGDKLPTDREDRHMMRIGNQQVEVVDIPSTTTTSSNTTTDSHQIETDTTDTLPESGSQTAVDASTGGTTEDSSSDNTDWSALESLSFCRTVDLDRCLLDISDQGVVPLTPMTYLTIMRK